MRSRLTRAVPGDPTPPLYPLSDAASTYIDIIAIIDYDEVMQTPGTAPAMSSITIRNLDPAIKERLRVRAAEHGHSMEAEARRILQTTLKGPARAPASNLYERIRALVDPLGGIDLALPPREPTRDPPTFD
jgi:antitoxin FitA